MKQQNIAQRKKQVLDGSTLELAIEGRFTNLQIWTGKQKEFIYMRIDKASQYSAPLNKESILYLDKQTDAMTALLAYPFGETPLSKLDEILEITKRFKDRLSNAW